MNRPEPSSRASIFMAVRTPLRIGTRGSPLALTQTDMARREIAGFRPEIETEVVVIKTSGDKVQDRPLADLGGKGLFTRELDDALLMGTIDLAVHSMKDMETRLPEGLQIRHMLPREDARDVMILRDITNNSQKISDLSKGLLVGTASVRRQAMLLARRPDLKIVSLRGNVQTRIDKVRGGQVEASLLALAGLKRLGLADQILKAGAFVIEPEEMLPSAGQGAVGIESRISDSHVAEMLDAINCRETLWRVVAERAALSVLDGSCHTPIGAHATLDAEGWMRLRVVVAALDGSALYEDEMAGIVDSLSAAQKLGQVLGERMKSVVPPDIFTQLAQG